MLFWSFTSQLWQPSTKHMAEVRKKVAQLPCCLFSRPKKRISRMVLGDTPGGPVRFCSKNTKFHTSSPKKNVQTCKVQEEDLLSPKCSSGNFDFWFENPDDLLGREFKFIYPAFLFCISSENIAPSDCFSGQVDCSLDYFLWILEKKYFDKIPCIQKNTKFPKIINSPQNLPLTA